MDIISLTDFISLNELIRFVAMNIISCQNIIALLIILFVNRYMLFERINISLTVNKYIISLQLNKYNSLKLHKYTVA